MWFSNPTISFPYKTSFAARLFRSPFINKIKLYGIPEYIPLPKIPPFPVIINKNNTNTSNNTVILNTTSYKNRTNVVFYLDQENWDSGELTWYDKIRNPNPYNSQNNNE
jgi:hypothetical protein